MYQKLGNEAMETEVSSDNFYEVDVPSEIFAAVKLNVEHMKVV